MGDVSKVPPTPDPNAIPADSPVPAPPDQKDKGWRPSDEFFLEQDKANGLPPGLTKAVMEAESSGNPAAKSDKGAYGYMQLEPDAAAEMGVNRDDPKQNIEGGSKYLAKQYRRFNGNLDMTLAAYNAGPRTVATTGGVPENPVVHDYIHKVKANMGLAGDFDDSASVPARQTDRLLDRMFNDPERKEAMKAYMAANKESQKADIELEMATKDYMDSKKKIMEEIRAIPRPEAPSLPEPPPIPKEVKTDPTAVLRKFLPVAAALMGLRTRAPATAALNALAAGQEAIQKNDKEEFERQQTVFKDKMEVMQEQWRDTREKYLDAFNDRKAAIQDRLDELQQVALLQGDSKMLDDLRHGRLGEAYQAVQMYDSTMYHLAPVLNEMTANDIRKSGQEETERYHRAIEQYNQDKLDPAKKAYQTAFEEAKSRGLSDEDAQNAANTALRKEAISAKPGTAGAAERAEEKIINQDPRIKTYRGLSYAFNELDSVTPEQMETATGQIRLLDAFTKMATGGQAIRQFMVNSTAKYLGWASQAEAMKQRLLTTKGAVMGKEAAEQYRQAAEEMRAGIRQAADTALASHARIIESRGEDPSDVIDPQDVQRLIQSGAYRPKRTDFGSAPAKDPGSFEDPTAAPPATPGASSDGWSIKPVS
jgi:hypothetical protein